MNITTVISKQKVAHGSLKQMSHSISGNKWKGFRIHVELDRAGITQLDHVCLESLKLRFDISEIYLNNLSQNWIMDEMSLIWNNGWSTTMHTQVFWLTFRQGKPYCVTLVMDRHLYSYSPKIIQSLKKGNKEMLARIFDFPFQYTDNGIPL
jgi:hypothetical protein